MAVQASSQRSAAFQPWNGSAQSSLEVRHFPHLFQLPIETACNNQLKHPYGYMQYGSFAAIPSPFLGAHTKLEQELFATGVNVAQLLSSCKQARGTEVCDRSKDVQQPFVPEIINQSDQMPLDSEEKQANLANTGLEDGARGTISSESEGGGDEEDSLASKPKMARQPEEGAEFCVRVEKKGHRCHRRRLDGDTLCEAHRLRRERENERRSVRRLEARRQAGEALQPAGRVRKRKQQQPSLLYRPEALRPKVLNLLSQLEKAPDQPISTAETVDGTCLANAPPGTPSNAATQPQHIITSSLISGSSPIVTITPTPPNSSAFIAAHKPVPRTASPFTLSSLPALWDLTGPAATEAESRGGVRRKEANGGTMAMHATTCQEIEPPELSLAPPAAPPPPTLILQPSQNVPPPSLPTTPVPAPLAFPSPSPQWLPSALELTARAHGGDWLAMQSRGGNGSPSWASSSSESFACYQGAPGSGGPRSPGAGAGSQPFHPPLPLLEARKGNGGGQEKDQRTQGPVEARTAGSGVSGEVEVVWKVEGGEEVSGLWERRSSAGDGGTWEDSGSSEGCDGGQASEAGLSERIVVPVTDRCSRVEKRGSRCSRTRMAGDSLCESHRRRRERDNERRLLARRLQRQEAAAVAGLLRVAHS